MKRSPKPFLLSFLLVLLLNGCPNPTKPLVTRRTEPVPVGSLANQSSLASPHPAEPARPPGNESGNPTTGDISGELAVSVTDFPLPSPSARVGEPAVAIQMMVPGTRHYTR